MKLRPYFTGNIPVVHGAFLVLVAQCVLHLGGGPGIGEKTLLRWDAVHYNAIRDHGYPGESSAFFPLFPYLWKLLQVGSVGMSLVNAVVYFIASKVLVKRVGMDPRYQMAFSVLPSVFFLFTPYTEALFFASSSLFLIGIRKRSMYHAAIGLFLCSLTRPAFTALLPSAVLVAMLAHEPLRLRVLKSLVHLMASLTGLFFVAFIQFVQTGDPIGFYRAQGDYGNTITWPDLPLGSWGGGMIVRLDATVLLAGMACGVYAVVEVYRRMKRPEREASDLVLVSAGYVACVSAIALFLRRGELYSLNRFVFATPFALVLLHGLISRIPKLSLRAWLLVWAAIIVYFLLFASYLHIRTFLLFAGVATIVAVGCYVLSGKTKLAAILYWPWIILMFCIQVLLFTRFLQGEWVA